MLPLANRIEEYFGDHAAQEDAGLNLTAARATTLGTALSTAMTTLAQKKQGSANAKKTRDAAIAAAQRCFRGLRDELKQLIPLDSADWLVVALHPPAWPDPPEAPLNPRATVIGGGKVLFECDRTPRVDRYSLWFKNGGGEFERQDTVLEPTLLMENLPVGIEISFVWRAANDTDTSPFSKEAKVTPT